MESQTSVLMTSAFFTASMGSVVMLTLVHSTNRRNSGGTQIVFTVLKVAIILVFSAFGGSIIPVNQMPGAFHWVSNITLNQWFIKGVEQIGSGSFPTLPWRLKALPATP